MNSESLEEINAPEAGDTAPYIGWERRAVIDLSAIRSNVKQVADLVAPAKVMAVVKADGYGHGALPVATAALEAGARWIGCAHVAEALALREAGIEAPMLAWLHTNDTPFEKAISAGIDLGVSGWDLELIAAAAQAVQTPARIHLKVDTGLGRNGSTMADLPSLLERSAKFQSEGLLRVVGVFSHLAVADEPERPETDLQLEVFDQAIEMVEAAGFNLEMRHVANTPAILSRPDSHHEMVRLGLGLYGLSPFEGETPATYGLRPAMKLVTKVANVKKVNTGQGVSYGLRYLTAKETYLALIPMGYADGLPRVATGAPVTIHGKTYPVRGTIAMDQCVIDLGLDIDPEQFLGAEAIIFGEGGESATTWAHAANTINYEMVTRISPRVPRYYVEGTWGQAGD
ncbi:alanine racemase [Arthrobacter sp. MYb229]|uniref:alanine racemase n=1 Tax=Micrococcaceae TaxID=1268 RepID=UPI000BB6CF70|nr:alanine racemase [Glutamicibacter sp. BW80]PRA07020.1 alanine racemase [Arthrobacter sp. MYb229]PRB53817.1 alanine racemase [Arthrobacter sp. MYb216]